MKKAITCIAAILIYIAASVTHAQAQEQSKGAIIKSAGQTPGQYQVTTLLARTRSHRGAGFALMPAAKTAAASGPAFVTTSSIPIPNLPVFGNGTVGRLTKWTGFTSTSSSIGDSNIYEDKLGKVGIGTTAPTSLLTVQGVIETSGGIKFSDGTTQTTSAAGALFGVAHDATLQGAGSGTSPLGVAVPLLLVGSVGGSADASVLTATNTGNGFGLVGRSTTAVGTIGRSTSGIGVLGQSDLNEGVLGISQSATGVRGTSQLGDGMDAQGGTDELGGGGKGLVAKGGDGSGAGMGGPGVHATGGFSDAFFGGDGIYAVAGTSALGPIINGDAGRFIGSVEVQGKLTKTMGTFKIDHPLDPENKYLYHSFVESPDMMNIYNGNITTDPNGEAVVEMPDYFDALNKDFRYQLTVIGTFAQAIVASEMKDNRFVIRTNAPGVKVSWMVTGVRKDAYAEKNRVVVEELKAEKERGFYLHPEVFNQPEEKSIEWARHPEMMLELKQQRLDSEARIKKHQQ